MKLIVVGFLVGRGDDARCLDRGRLILRRTLGDGLESLLLPSSYPSSSLDAESVFSSSCPSGPITDEEVCLFRDSCLRRATPFEKTTIASWFSPLGSLPVGEAGLFGGTLLYCMSVLLFILGRGSIWPCSFPGFKFEKTMSFSVFCRSFKFWLLPELP